MISVPSLEKMLLHRESLLDDESGMTVDLAIYSADAKASTKTTPLILYVVGTAMPRVGTDSDETILSDLLGRGYLVAVLDYLGDARSVTPVLEWSVQRMKMHFLYHPDFYGRVLAGVEYSKKAAYILPSGYNLKRQLCFWSFDRHGVAGSFDFIISVWNSDFLGVWGNKGVITYPDGRQETVREYTERLPEGRVTDIYQCIKRDGKPIDMNLYMDILYPTHPREEVPVMMYAQSAQDTVGTWNKYERPHLSGFLFGGYGVALFDFGYIPMSRSDNWGYFDGDGLGSVGGVTGDNYTYSLGKPNNMRANTAAVRFLRYLAASEPETYRFRRDRFGVIGISKTGNTLRLGHPTPELLRESRFLEGHWGESRYEIGETAGDGMGEGGADLIRGGEAQPWLTYPDGTPISSRVQFVYTSVGSGEYAISDGYVPIYSCGTTAKGGSYAAFWPKVMSRAYTHDIPALGYVCPGVGHSFGIGPDRDTGVDTVVALYEMADYYLKGGAPRVEYLLPRDGEEVEATVHPTVCLNAPIPESEFDGITLCTESGEPVPFTVIPSYGNTHFELVPQSLVSGRRYTLSVSETLCSSDGRRVKSGASSSFTVAPAFTESRDVSVRLDFDKPLSLKLTSDVRAIRFYVGNDAAAAVLAFGEDGELLGRVSVGGIGVCELALKEHPGGEVTLRTERCSGEYPVYSETFDGEAVPSSISGDTVLVITDELGKRCLKVADVPIVDRFAPYHRYYNGPQTFLSLRYADGFTDADYGRRFTVSTSLYDTAVRQLGFTVGRTSCRVGTEAPLIDCRAHLSTYTTRPGEWVERRFRIDLRNPEGLAEFEKNRIDLYGETWGSRNAECPIYLGAVTVRETVTDVMLSHLTLVK